MEKPPGSALPNCNHCTHYYITYDANFRYGCRAFNFKSARAPSLEVLEASGQQCHLFVQKQKGRPQAG
ncbi:hypothetical protein [Undibacterium sp.]|uniref:hypothetical protein n=1 Tax=Undibacterium sp. TaxID=1914977 RepID=UPI00374CA989